MAQTGEETCDDHFGSAVRRVEGSGRAPAAKRRRYRQRPSSTGTLKSNGKKFDSYGVGGEPFEFKLGAGMVIKGWDQGVAGIKVGGKRQTHHLPAALAYVGKRSRAPDIPPDADLRVFEGRIAEDQVTEGPHTANDRFVASGRRGPFLARAVSDRRVAE